MLDFDDLMDGNDPLEVLLHLKERDPGFKVTLFAIPTRCSKKLLARYEPHKEWVRLGIHGWRHSRHECLAWTSEETEVKLQLAMEVIPWADRIFKAPNWEFCDEVYDGCQKQGFSVADHIRNMEIRPPFLAAYVYNKRLRNDQFQRAHGHIQPWAGTGLSENPNSDGVNPNYLFPVGTPYATVKDVLETDASPVRH